MSGTAWRERARRIVTGEAWPAGISEVDRLAVEDLAAGEGYEPYYTLKIVIHLIETGCYEPIRLSPRDQAGRVPDATEGASACPDGSAPIPPPEGSSGVEIRPEPEMRRGAWLRMAPGGMLAPHCHEAEDEEFLVIEGEVEIRWSREPRRAETWDRMPVRTRLGAREVGGALAGYWHAIQAGPRGALLLASLDEPESGEPRVRELSEPESASTCEHRGEWYGDREYGTTFCRACHADITTEVGALAERDRDFRDERGYIVANPGEVVQVRVRAALHAAESEACDRDTKPDTGEASENPEAGPYTRAQLAAAVDEAHAALHEAAAALDNAEGFSAECLAEIELRPLLERAHEALHRVGAGMPRVRTPRSP